MPVIFLMLVATIFLLSLQSFSVIKRLLDNCGGSIGDSYFRHWIAIVGLYAQVSFLGL